MIKIIRSHLVLIRRNFLVRHDSIDDFTVNDDNTVGQSYKGDYLPLMFSTLPTTRRYTMQPGACTVANCGLGEYNL